MSVMEITYSLSLPRDEASVPVVRHLVAFGLRRLGVMEACTADVGLAVTEACSNVLKHAGDGHDDYRVEVRITPEECDIRVVDTGAAAERRPPVAQMAAPHEESGRGLYLMRALVDDLHFVAQPDSGMSVRFNKRLALTRDSVLQRLGTSYARS